MRTTLKDWKKSTVWQLALLLLINLVVLPTCMAAETADDYFHTGAQDYIFGDKDKAKTQILTGLQYYPTDPKLNGVIKLLRRPEQKPPPSKKNSDDSEKQKNDKQNEKQGQKGQQQNKDDKDNQGKNDKEKQQQKQQEAKANPSDKRDKNPENQEGMAEGKMSPEEAKQLLDAQQENEKVLIFAPSNQPVSTLSAKIKDW